MGGKRRGSITSSRHEIGCKTSATLHLITTICQFPHLLISTVSKQLGKSKDDLKPTAYKLMSKAAFTFLSGSSDEYKKILWCLC